MCSASFRGVGLFQDGTAQGGEPDGNSNLIGQRCALEERSPVLWVTRALRSLPPVAERPGIVARMTWKFDPRVIEVRREMVGWKHIRDNDPGEGNYDAGERFSVSQKVLILRSGGIGGFPALGRQDGLVCMQSNSTETKARCIEHAFRVSLLSSE